jgi:hypothetical protein
MLHFPCWLNQRWLNQWGSRLYKKMGNLKRQSFEVRCTYKTTKNITSTLPNVENKNSISETKDNKTKRSTITKRRQLQHTRSLLLAKRLRAHHTYYRLIKIGFSYSTYNLFWDYCTVNQNLNTDRKTSRFDDQSTAFFLFPIQRLQDCLYERCCNEF